MTFEDICEIEPRVKALRDRVAEMSFTGRAKWETWVSVKRELSSLVGWNSYHRDLSSSDCYEICVSELLKAAKL